MCKAYQACNLWLKNSLQIDACSQGLTGEHACHVHCYGAPLCFAVRRGCLTCPEQPWIMLQMTWIHSCTHKLVLRWGVQCCCHPSISHGCWGLSALVLTQIRPGSCCMGTPGSCCMGTPGLCCMGTPGPWQGGQRLRGVPQSPEKEGFKI